MKSNKGMTVMSVIIYVIVLSVVIGTMSIILRYFYKNTNETVISNDSSQQYTRFIAYFTDDINSGNIIKENVIVTSNDIKLTYKDSSIHEYLYENQNIYYIVSNGGNIDKKIILCSKIEQCQFTKLNDKIMTKIKVGDTVQNLNFNIK